MTDEENLNIRREKGDNKMNSREELLQSLYGAKEIIEQAEEITRRYNETKRKLQAKRTFVPVGGTAVDNVKYALAVMVLVFSAFFTFIIIFVSSLLELKGGKPVGIIGFLIVTLIVMIKVWRHEQYCKEVNENRKKVVAEQNEEIARYNEQVQKEAEEINREMDEIRVIAGQRLYGWYPPAYMYSEAVIFFIGAIQNFKANNIQEAVNLFDKKLYENEQLEIQRGMTELQRQQNNLQKMQNVLSAVNAFVNLGAAFNSGKIANNTGRMANDINSIKNNVYNNYR